MFTLQLYDGLTQQRSESSQFYVEMVLMQFI